MEKHNEERIIVIKYELHYKNFIAFITIRRSDMQWDFRIMDMTKQKISDIDVDIHFMSEQDIETRIQTSIDDCIKNPEEYY